MKHPGRAETLQIQNAGWKDIYLNTIQLYSTLKDRQPEFKLHQVAVRCGEVPADPLDFVLDIEITLKREMNPVEYGMSMRLIVDNPALMPEYLQIRLGKAFKDRRLDLNGDYSLLYFHAIKAARIAADEEYRDLSESEQSNAEDLFDDEDPQGFSVLNPIYSD